MVRDISACMCEYNWSGLTEAAAPHNFFFTNDSKIGRFSGFFLQFCPDLLLGICYEMTCCINNLTLLI